MKKQLAQIFANQCVTVEEATNLENYFWYLDESNTPLGISTQISPIEKELIELNYQAIDINAAGNSEKLLWLNFLMSKNSEKQPNFSAATVVKFIFISHALDVDLQQEFEALVQGFNSNFKVFFTEENYGVILDFSNMEDDSELADFLLAATTDFTEAINFYLTRNYEINPRLPAKFNDEFEVFKKFQGKGSILRHKDIFLNYLMSSEVVSAYPIFGDWFERSLLMDKELLQVVKCYLENGFNVTNGAKILHMHRNTFMNKLDRFTQLTGLDIKNFDEATVAYLLIRLRKGV